MSKVFDYAEVATHNTAESCWVVLYGDVYDVTEFISEHPGGGKVILQLAGKDATQEYDPVHPAGTLEQNLKPEQKLGTVNVDTLPPTEKSPLEMGDVVQDGSVNLDTLLNLDDIEEVATKQISQKGWAYYYSASDDLFSKTFNNKVYRQILLRARVFVDCVNCDTSTSFLGHKVKVPIYVSPAAMARLAHPDGEWGIAQACEQYGAMQVISQNASMTPEQIVADANPDQVFGWQLYVQNERAKSEAMLVRINNLPQIKFICLTLDAPVPGKREHDERSKNVGANLPVRAAVQEDASVSKTSSDAKTPSPAKAMGVGQSLFWGTAADLTWKKTLPWLAQHTKLPIVLKGIQTHEDAYLASLHAPQVKAIILSNHGGRALDTASPAVHTLLEIRKYCPEVFDRIEVWIDGGIKRGTDVVKALCLGARGVGIGRPALFGLGAGGKEGVARVLEILKAETETCMRLLGVGRVDELGMHHINARAVERDIYDGPAGLERPSLRERLIAKL
ncbi:FMN-dependent dehydrogenase-domain-containing protein [Massariosphaeria phaeospora]|uniref:L-lactate dehydrogenase (cytochrome) n=1 Tax=Massariosphaeria phaeospora TaxID=100035 RepID=A0A7C8INB4_9PLEO|nr:FMN-dependent dehydrogenase-domain-containing protein [Massariosphaeria phaeospora]